MLPILPLIQKINESINEWSQSNLPLKNYLCYFSKLPWTFGLHCYCFALDYWTVVLLYKFPKDTAWRTVGRRFLEGWVFGNCGIVEFYSLHSSLLSFLDVFVISSVIKSFAYANRILGVSEPKERGSLPSLTRSFSYVREYRKINLPHTLQSYCKSYLKSWFLYVYIFFR